MVSIRSLGRIVIIGSYVLDSFFMPNAFAEEPKKAEARAEQTAKELTLEEKVRIAELKVKEEPTAENYASLAEHYISADRLDEAEKVAKKGIEIDGKNAHAHNELGRVYYRRKDYKKAEEEYKLSLKLDQNFFDANHNYGLLLAKEGRYEESFVHLKKALDTQPDNKFTISWFDYVKKKLNR